MQSLNFGGFFTKDYGHKNGSSKLKLEYQETSSNLQLGKKR